MNKFQRLLMGICLALLVSPIAQAELHLELTQGVSNAIPIAVMPLQGQTKNVAGHTTIAQVIRDDLQDSGQFNVKQPGLLSTKPTTLSAVDFKAWRGKKVNNLVIGSIQAVGNDQFKVHIELVGLFSQPLAVLKQNPQAAVLLDQTYTTRTAGLRGLAHHLADLIYQKLTGVKGVFATKIAYILVQYRQNQPTRYSLEIADADGFNPQELVVSNEPIMSPAWSPDGRSIAYVSFEGNQAAIYFQNIYTGQRRLLSRFPGINGAPAFSPDGKKLALVLTLSGNPNVYIMKLADAKLTQVTNDYAIDTEPAWAPDGKSIIFTSSRGGGPQIYRYTFSTKKIQRLTFTGNYNARASFLPDGQAIVMMHRDSGLFGIATQDLQTGRVDVLVQTGEDESPSVAPNGNMVIYATRANDRGVLAQVSINGQVKIRLPAREGSVREPAWSPF